MTQEEKQLLLVDLCARLPYEIIVEATYKDGEGWKTEDRKLLGIYEDSQVYVDAVYANIENVRPYLRPMSSMTEEERQEYGLVLCDELSINQYDWLNSHHFDYRGLIEKGFAIEVTKENNPYKG